MTEWVKRMGKRPFVRFLIVGSLNTILTYMLFLLLSGVLHYSVAYTLSFVAGIAFSYVFAAIYIFGTGFAMQSALRFPFIYVVQYLYGLSALFVLIDFLGVWRQVAILFVIISSVPLTFVLMHLVMHPGKPSWFSDGRRNVGAK